MKVPLADLPRALPLVACLLVLPGASCAVFESSSSPESAAYRTEPAAEAPRIDVDWRRGLDVQEVGDYRPRQFASPTLVRGRESRDLVVGTDDGTVFRLEAASGEIQWEKTVDGAVHASPAASSQRVVAGTVSGSVHAFDRGSGEEIWQQSYDYGVESPPTIADGIVYLTTNAGRMIALDASTGKEEWTYSRSTPKEFTIKGAGTPRVVDDTVYCGFADGKLVALNVDSGDERWVADAAGGEVEFADVDAPVFVGEDRVYATSYGGGIGAFRRKGGGPVWSRTFENVSGVDRGGSTLYAAIATGRVVALDVEDGSSVWGFEFQNDLPVEVTVAGPYLFVATGSGPLYVLDRQTGYPLLRWRPSPGFNTEPVFSRRGGYVMTNKGYVYGFRLAY